MNRNGEDARPTRQRRTNNMQQLLSTFAESVHESSLEEALERMRRDHSSDDALNSIEYRYLTNGEIELEDSTGLNFSSRWLTPYRSEVSGSIYANQYENDDDEEDDEDEEHVYYSEDEERLSQYLEELEDDEEFDADAYEYMRNNIVSEGFGMFALQLYVKILRSGYSCSMYFTTSDDDSAELSEESFSFIRNLLSYSQHIISNKQKLDMNIARHAKRTPCQCSSEYAVLNNMLNCHKITMLMDRLPSLDEFEWDYERLNNGNLQDTLLKKILIDVYYHYLISIDGPNFDQLQRQLIPIAIRFYSKLSRTTVELLRKQIDELTRSTERHKVLILPLDSASQSLSYFRNQSRVLCNISGGFNSSRVFL